MQEIHVVGAAIRDGDRVLVAQRSCLMDSALKWEFAGGKVENGETHEQALQREISEELNIRIRVGAFVASGSSAAADKRIILHVYEAELLEGVPVSNEHAQLKWVNIKDMVNLDWAEADIPVMTAILNKRETSTFKEVHSNENN